MTPSDEAGLNLTDSVQIGDNAIGPTTGDIIINSAGNHEICSMCKTPIDAVNNAGLFCFKEGCESLFCNNCESFFRESRKAGEKPYCAEHIDEALRPENVPAPPSVGAIVSAVLRDTKSSKLSTQPPQSQIIGTVNQQVPMQAGAQVFVDAQNPIAVGQMQIGQPYNPYLHQKMINPAQAIINIISNLSGEGRAQRSEFWFGYLFFSITYSFFIGIFYVLLSSGSDINEGLFFLFVAGVFVSLIPILSLMIRRIHDTGNSGWWILLIWIPYIGAIAMFVFAIMPSEPRPNQYDRR